MHNIQTYHELPDFDENGTLPPGIYAVNLDIILTRFGGSKSLKRSQLTRNFREFYNFIKYYSIGIYVDGSYTTTKMGPSDIDLIVILPPEFKQNRPALERYLGFLWNHKINHLHIIGHFQGEEDVLFQSKLDWFTHTRPPKREKGIVYLETK
jgi:predicted nucleotidyltransferase